MNNWSIDSNWYYVSLVLATIILLLWRDLRDANQRKKQLGEIAQNLSKRVYELEAMFGYPTRTPMSPGNSTTPDAAPPPPADTP